MCAKTYISTSIVHYKKAETGVSNKLNAYYFGNRSVFRGALNCHRTDAEAYSKLKEMLAKQYSEDRGAYTASKSELISEIIVKAHYWRRGQSN